MSIQDIQAIDVHVHAGLNLAGENEIPDTYMRGDVHEVIRRARRANIGLSIISPFEAIFPRFGADPVSGNIHAREEYADLKNVMQYVVIDPLKEETYRQAEEILPLPQCAGIKIHPEEHGYPIKEHGKALFEFAAKHKAIVLTHSGEGNSLPEDFVPFANDYPEVRLILAHIGCCIDKDMTHQVRAVELSKHGNMYADTSSGASIFPGLIEWAARQIGADKILFGTDALLYFEPMQRIRIDSAEMPDEDKKKILRDNAIKLFSLDLKE